MARFLAALLLIVCLAVHQVAGQASFSVSSSFSSSATITNSVSISGSGSNSGSGSISGTGSGSITGSVSTSGSNSVSASVTNSGSVSLTVTPSASNTITPPPSPINIVNTCPNHIINICPSWEDPAGVVFTSYVVAFIQSGCSTCTETTFTTGQTSGRITNLLPATSYDITVRGVLASGLRSDPSTVATFTTDPADPKLDPTLDINSISCVGAFDQTTQRSVINCTWNAAADTLTRLVIKWRCSNPLGRNSANKKRLYGTDAQATSVTLRVNRGVATCAVYFRAYYARRPATRHALTVIMGN